MTPEQRIAARAKGQATRDRKKAEAAAAAEAAPAVEEPPTLASLGLAAEPEDDFRLDDILTNEEIEAIKAKAREQVAKERRQKRARLLMDLATDEARRELGLVPVDEAFEREMAELGDIRINLPRLRLANGRECPPDPIIIDQRVFVHGRTYQNITLAQRLYLADLMGKAWMHVAQVDGRSRTYYNEQLGTMVYPGGLASGGGSAGFGFDAIHRRPA